MLSCFTLRRGRRAPAAKPAGIGSSGLGLPLFLAFALTLLAADPALAGCLAGGLDEEACVTDSAVLGAQVASAGFFAGGKFVPEDGQAQDGFGGAVAISTDTVVVGANGDDDNGEDSGSAYVLAKDDSGNWVLEAKLLASDGAAFDFFGTSVAVSGDTVLVGAYWDDDNGFESGSAYVFVRDGVGNWSEQAKLLASDGASADFFGGAVALDGDTAVVGAIGNDSVASSAGAGYVFVRDGSGVWSEETKLVAADGAAGDFFAGSVAVDGDTVLVGALRDNDNGAVSGSVYVYLRETAGGWVQQAKLLAEDGSAHDQFSHSLGLSGNTAIVGAIGDADNGVTAGSAYVFLRDGAGVWTQQAKLLASDGIAADVFGRSVDVSGGLAVVGAERDDDKGIDAGSVYLFARDANGDWLQSSKLVGGDGTGGDHFGFSAAIDGDTTVIGADGVNDRGLDSGAIYLLTLPTLSCGDANGDGSVTASDALFTLKASTGVVFCSTAFCDVNNDGSVTTTDALIVLQISIGLNLQLNCPG